MLAFQGSTRVAVEERPCYPTRTPRGEGDRNLSSSFWSVDQLLCRHSGSDNVETGVDEQLKEFRAGVSKSTGIAGHNSEELGETLERAVGAARAP